MSLPEKSGSKGVYFNAGHNAYIVSITKNKKQIFLGEFPATMLDMAKRCRQEAEDLTADELPALRVKYGQLRAEQGGRAFTQRGKGHAKKNGHKPEAEQTLADLAEGDDSTSENLMATHYPPTGVTLGEMLATNPQEVLALTFSAQPTLAELIEAANEADAQMRLWQAQAAETSRQAQAAQDAAVAAWNAVVAELTRLGANGSALWLTDLGHALIDEAG